MAAGPIIMASRLFCVIQMKGWRSRPLCATGNASVSTVMFRAGAANQSRRRVRSGVDTSTGSATPVFLAAT